MAATLTEISKIDPNFNKDNFLKECEREIIPTVLEVSLFQTGIVLLKFKLMLNHDLIVLCCQLR